MSETMKFTAIFTESWVAGSHMHTLTRMRRIEQLDGETVEDMLAREGIEDNMLYLFEGHPLLQGESDNDSADEAKNEKTV